MEFQGPIHSGHVLGCLFMFCIVTAIYKLDVAANPYASKIIVINGDRGSIQSQNFPTSCCDPENVTLEFDPDSVFPGYIHLTFDDLDLPPGVFFKIYKDVGETVLYSSQPEYKYGTWRRPFISTDWPSSLIRLVIQPIGVPNYNKTDYSGFKASYEVKADKTAYYQRTSELCGGQVASSEQGGQIHVKPQPVSFENLWLDCLWLIKPPRRPVFTDEKKGRKTNLTTYVRFDDLEIVQGTLKILQGTNSESPLLMAVNNIEDLNQPPEGIMSVNTDTGFYIRALLPADDRRSRITFVYGYYEHVEEGLISALSCTSHGFLCAFPYSNWCLPKDHECNNVKNCPDGTDEMDCPMKPDMYGFSTISTTTTTTIRTSTTTSRECAQYNHLCSDGRCVSYSFHCDNPNIGKAPCEYYEKLCEDGSCEYIFWDTNVCPEDCSDFQKECAGKVCIDDSKYCPEEECPSYTPNRCDNNEQCFSDADHCDDTEDCWDGSDERNCPWHKQIFKGQHFLLGMLGFGLMLIFLIVVCCRKHCKGGSVRAPATGANEGTRLRAVLSSGANRDAAYTSVPTNANSNVATDNANSNEPNAEPASPLPPPSYEEVTSTNTYPQPPQNQEPPPPSYESTVQASSDPIA